MTAPTLGNSRTGFNTGNTTSTNVLLPIFTDGDALYIAMTSDAAGQTFTAPSGWSTLYSNVAIPATSSTATFALFYLVNAVHAGMAFDGTDYNVSVGLGTTERQAWVTWVVAGDGGIDAQGTNATGNSATATIPAVTTDINNCLIFGVIGTDGVSTPHGSATGYTQVTEVSGASAGSVSVYYTTLASLGTQASATLSITNEQWLGVSFAIKPKILGDSAITLGALTVSATGTSAISGTAAITLGALTVSAAGLVPRTGTAAITLGALTISAMGTGLGTINGTAAITLGALTVSATGVHTATPINGTAAITLGALSVAATGYLAVDLPAPTLRTGHTTGADTGNTTYTNITLPTFTDGDTIYIAIVSDALSQVFSAPVPYFTPSNPFATLYSNVAIPTSSSTATFALFYQQNAHHADFSFDGTNYNVQVYVTTPERQAWIAWSIARGGIPDEQGINDTGSSATATIPAVTPLLNNSLLFGVVATDGVSTPHTGASNYTQLAEISGTSAGSLSVWSHTLSTAAVYGPDSVSIASEQWLGVSFSIPPTLTGSAAITLGSLTVSAAGTIPRTGTADIMLGALTVSSTGLVPRTGTAAITLGALTITSLPARTGTAAITLGALTTTATGIVLSGRVGNALITLGALTISAASVTAVPRMPVLSSKDVPPVGRLFQISIENADGVKLGGGPLVTAIKWTYKQKISQAGEWTLEVPLAEPRLQFATLKRRVHCYVRRSGRIVWLGGGIIESRSYGLSGDNVPAMLLSGPDLLRELAGVTVKFEVDALDSPPRTPAILNQILAAVPVWGSIILDTELPEITARFVHESVLNALISTCEKIGAFFWMEPYTVAQRTILIATTPIYSDIIATNMADPIAVERNPNICLISNIEKTETSWDAYNRLIVYGAGDGQARLTLAAATVWPNDSGIDSTYMITDPYGRNHSFVLDKATNTVTDTLAVTDYGTIEKAVAFKEIAPITPNDADMRAAANTLVVAAVNQLVLSSFPTNTYRLSVAALRKVVHPGMQIRVQARKVRDGILHLNVDERLIIQEVDYEIDTNGERVTGLTVATTWKPEKTGATILSEQIQKLTSLEAHPQIGANENTLTYREDVDDEYGAAFPFWLSSGTQQINSVTLRYKLESLRSSVKSVGGTATGTVNVPAHSHTLSAHNHVVGNHQHNMAFEPGSGGSTVQIFSGGGSPDFGSIVANGIPHTIYVNTNDQSGAVTSDGNSSITVGGGATGGITVDISNAITAVYGVFVDRDPPYTVNDLDWSINGQRITTTPLSMGSGWYEVDITRYMIDTSTLRPIAYANTVMVVVKSLNHAGKRVRVTTQIELRTTIQTLAALPPVLSR